jgi:alpha-1,3-rhamnosyl/mannosyltransferase
MPKRHVLFLGTLEARKNLDGLLDAWTRVLAARPDALPLVVAGRPTQDAAPALARMQRPPLSGHVQHLGYVSAAERESLYRDAIALVLPSLHEGFGMTALEAMTAGVPVIAARRGALPELVGDAGILVDPENADAMAAAILSVLGDTSMRDRLSVAGRRRAEAYSWDESADRLLEAYRAAAAEPPRA